MFHQTFQPRDLLLVLLLIILEGLLSIDNAMVLAILARKLPDEKSQSKALTYGLVGSMVLRVTAIFLAAWLLKWRIVKLLGGLYLLYVALKYFVAANVSTKPPATSAGNERTRFWTVVASIELTDIAFAADSILASIALVGPMPPGYTGSIHPKLWLIVLGGMLGVLMMRVAAVGFIRLLKRFPNFETAAYLLVTTVGIKLILDWWYNAREELLNFQSPASPAFWVFWSVMLLCISVGFLPRGKLAG